MTMTFYRKLKFALLPSLALTVASLAAPLQAETLRMSNWVPTTHYLYTDVFKPWADDVEKATEGRVKVNILPKALGTPPQHWELARKGIADITWGNFTYEPDRFQSIWFAEFPSSGRDARAQSIALWNSYNKYLQADKAYAGVKVLGVGMFGGGQMHHGSKSMVKLEDVAGQKFRMGGPIQQVLIENLGGVPVSAPATKAYEMLESKVIDGSLHTFESVESFRLQDVLTYHTLFDQGFYDATFFLIMNAKKWDRLSPEDQAAIEKVSGENFSVRWGEAFNAHNASAEQALRDAGHTFSEPSPALLAKVTEIREQMVADWELAAKDKGIDDPRALLADFESDYKRLEGE
ncbi:MAG TPA: TRAP transporter substrate-binding protein [Thiolinea sp.]|nr:TRAP transporter substrate-binding protein [Thiolinea sp.]